VKVGNARRARQDPEYQLKHRVTGAAIIAAAAALSLALLLGEPGGGGAGDGDAQTIRFDFGDGDSADSTAAVENTVTEPAVVTVLPAAGVDSAAAENDGETPAAVAVDAAGWAVQVGAFDEQSGIDETVAKFKSANFPVTTVQPGAGEKWTRVWLGPYPDRQTATDALARALDAGAPADSFVVAPSP